MSHNTMGAMGDMAKNFVPGNGAFNPSGHYEAIPSGKSAFAFDARTMNTQAAMNSAMNFGGGVLPQGMGMMAGILPAALKIQEHQQMQEVADKYYEKYIKDFNRKYGFSDKQIKDLVEEFNEVTTEIANLIPDKEMRSMYEKYIQSYPTMYLSMIPAEALQTKLAVKCVTENAVLRRKIEDMSSSVSNLVKNLTDLQISAGIPPIVNLMFESMPDPLTAITDPMYHKYNDAILTYHKILKNGQPFDRTFSRVDPQSTANARITKNNEFLRLEPVHYLKQLAGKNADLDIIDENGNHLQNDDGTNMKVSAAEITSLYTVMNNMLTQSGCQPFGEEWNHTGPTPPMNPAMCLSEENKFQPGNPRHNEGRTNLYQAKRDQSGNAQWVQAGQIPALSSGGPQMVQHQPQAMQQPDPWAGQRHMPGVDPRPMQQAPYRVPSVQPGQFNQQFVGSGGRPRSGSKTPKQKKSSRGTKSGSRKSSAKKRNSSPV